MYFIILDFESDFEVSFILGCQFLATGKDITNVASGNYPIKTYSKLEVINTSKTPKKSENNKELLTNHEIEDDIKS